MIRTGPQRHDQSVIDNSSSDSGNKTNLDTSLRHLLRICVQHVERSGNCKKLAFVVKRKPSPLLLGVTLDVESMAKRRT
jgi:hypothetical protein